MYIPIDTPRQEWSSALSQLVETVNGNWMWRCPPGSFFLNSWSFTASADGESWIIAIDMLYFNKAAAAIQLRLAAQADWSFLDPAEAIVSMPF